MLYCDGLSYDEFRMNSLLIEACVFNLSQMGELASKLDKEYQAVHPHVPWKKLYGLRNRIVHDYEGIQFLLIWEIIRDNLPALIEQLAATAQTGPNQA